VEFSSPFEFRVPGLSVTASATTSGNGLASASASVFSQGGLVAASAGASTAARWEVPEGIVGPIGKPAAPSRWVER
jgi:hypothetical protein